MKNAIRIFSVMLILSFCFAFTSCAKTNENNSMSNITSENSQNSESKKTTNKSENKSFEYEGKTVKDVVLNLIDSKISLGTENAEELLNIENLYDSVDVPLSIPIGEIVFVYSDDTEYEYGKIYMGEKSNKYYLQIEKDGKTNTYELNENITNKN